MDEFISKLRELNIGTVKENEPMANHTTMKIGGPADLFIEPSSIENLAKAMELIRRYELKWRAIGRGSNLLVSDGGIEGVVIKLGRGMDHLDLNETELKAGGGYSVVALSTIISKKACQVSNLPADSRVCRRSSLYERWRSRFRYFTNPDQSTCSF